ncbi:hypothetical protein ACROYT_G019162 [Oculina patagonica]
MQRKTEKLIVNAGKLGMNVNIPKTKVLKVNGKVNSPISLGGEDIESVEEFCYLRSVISTDGGTDKDISVRIGKARERGKLDDQGTIGSDPCCRSRLLLGKSQSTSKEPCTLEETGGRPMLPRG